MEIKFNLEGIEDEAFFALYSGLRKVRDHYRSLQANDQFSLTSGAAFYMLRELRINHPEEYKNAKAEYDSISSLKST